MYQLFNNCIYLKAHIGFLTIKTEFNYTSMPPREAFASLGGIGFSSLEGVRGSYYVSGKPMRRLRRYVGLPSPA